MQADEAAGSPPLPTPPPLTRCTHYYRPGAEFSDVAAQDRIRFEIAGNIARHAAERPLEFSLHVQVHPDRLEAVFTDLGRRVDIDIQATGLPDDLSESGRGLGLARAAVDEFEYRRDGNVNRWRVMQRRADS